MINTTAVLGYAWPLIVNPGEPIAFHLSSASLAAAHAMPVRIRLADPDTNGPGLRETEYPGAIPASIPLRHQPIHPGSHATIPASPALNIAGSFSVGCFLWPTLLAAGAQSIIASEGSGTGWRLGLTAAGTIEFAIGPHRVSTSRKLIEREWVFVGAHLDTTTSTIRVFQTSLDPQAGRDTTATAQATAATTAITPGQALKIAGNLNGKIDRPRLIAAALDATALQALCERVHPDLSDPALIAAWDFSQGISTTKITDLSPNGLHGTLHQQPARAMTGANWTARTHSWTEAPDQYGAIHFHDDDMADCGWSPDIHLAIPSDWRPGFYALRLRAETASGDKVESYVPFFIRAPVGRATQRLAFVASTATWLAYANSALRLDQTHAESMLEGLPVLTADDLYLQEHRELGLSTYDTHSDGSGWCYSSAARPILNMRPRGATFNYGNDTHLLDWLEAQSIPYDIITDEDIHHHGPQVLKPYACVITGSHPEYFSERMLNAFDAYQRNGGRHMYLGGNGFYWRIGWAPDRPHAMEIRRGTQGTRTWEGEPGENSLSTTGEPSGLWRASGRAPQRLVGVGFDAQVFNRSFPYHRKPASFDPGAGFVFDGIGPDEIIGDFGLRGGGAAGLEIDRADTTLGSPPSLLLLASADRIDYGGLPSPEEFRTTHRGLTGDQNANVRADMVLFPTAKGGAVFTTGSIAWVCSLSHNHYENNVSRITGNVLRRFLDPTPLAGFPE